MERFLETRKLLSIDHTTCSVFTLGVVWFVFFRGSYCFAGMQTSFARASTTVIVYDDNSVIREQFILIMDENDSIA